VPSVPTWLINAFKINFGDTDPSGLVMGKHNHVVTKNVVGILDKGAIYFRKSKQLENPQKETSENRHCLLQKWQSLSTCTSCRNFSTLSEILRETGKRSVESNSNEDDGMSHVEQKLSTVISASKRLLDEWRSYSTFA